MPAAPVDLYGWDTALALRLGAFNRLLGAVADDGERTQPTINSAGAPVALTWRFAAWRIVEAVGSRLALELSLASGSNLRIGGQPPKDVSAYVIAVTIDMQLQRGAAALTVRPAQSWWGNLGVDPGEAPLGFAVDVLVTKAFSDWFGSAAAIDAFNKRFAALSIGPQVPATLAPAVFGFAGTGLPGGDHAVGLLARTAPSTDTLGASYTLSPYVIADKVEAAFAVSAPSFFTKLLMPALPFAFGDGSAKADDCFELRGTTVYNKATLSFPLTTQGGNTYDAKIDPGQLELAFDGDALTLHVAQMTFAIGVGKATLVNVHVTFTERLRPTLTSRPGSATALVFGLEQAQPPDVQHDSEATLLELGGQLLIDIVFAIVTVLLSRFGARFFAARGLSPLAAKLSAAITAVIAQAIGQVVENVPDILAHFEEVSLDQLPDFGHLLDGALASLQWQDGTRYQLNGARFADALVLDVSLVAK